MEARDDLARLLAAAGGKARPSTLNLLEECNVGRRRIGEPTALYLCAVLPVRRVPCVMGVHPGRPTVLPGLCRQAGRARGPGPAAATQSAIANGSMGSGPRGYAVFGRRGLLRAGSIGTG